MAEAIEEIVIVGAGVSGLTTALSLHKLGLRSLVLESSNSMRASGFHLSMWTNAWKAFDEIGIANSLHQQHIQIPEMVVASMDTGLPTRVISLRTKATWGNHEVRRILRKNILGALEKELPCGTVRYSSKVVSIEESGHLKMVHLADGSILKTKVLIGCDGINSVVAKWLGFKKPAFDGRSEVKGRSYFEHSHPAGPNYQLFFGKGVSLGIIPSDNKCVYWFCTFNPSTQDTELAEDPAKLKQFVLRNTAKVPDQIVTVIENTELVDIACYQLSFQPPWEVRCGNISKGNVCVAGDAFHPMTPDIGQGGGSAVEDGIILARCLAEALSKKSLTEGSLTEEEEYENIRVGLSNYAKQRQWRGFKLIAIGYLMGLIQDSNWKVINLLRDKVLLSYLAGLKLKIADFDCGKLRIL